MKYLIAMATVLFSSCSSDDSDQFIVDTHIDVLIKDSNGNNLLDPENVNSYKEEQIKIFYLVNGQQSEVNNSNLDYPKGFFIYEHENEFRIRIFPNSDKNEETPVTYIMWNNTDIDTIKCSIERKSNSEICKKVWLNDNLVWEAYETERFFEIIK